ncbi:DoxX family protein [Nocardia nepalensis]|uniref:DoxX family protein n=1 Tax=Nocardia nepalensis TaxID=3375448 RepID=UPI003B67185C
MPANGIFRQPVGDERLSQIEDEPDSPAPQEKLMNLALWIVAGLLAALALSGGVTKAFMPKAKLDDLGAKSGGGWTMHASAGFVRTLGGLEILAAIGLTLPATLDIAPVLVPVTAVCWILLMIGAMITHARYHQYQYVALNLVYLALAAFVAWGRFGSESFTG